MGYQESLAVNAQNKYIKDNGLKNAKELEENKKHPDRISKII